MRTRHTERTHLRTVLGALAPLVLLGALLIGCSAAVDPTAGVRLEVIDSAIDVSATPSRSPLEGATLRGAVTIVVWSDDVLDAVSATVTPLHIDAAEPADVGWSFPLDTTLLPDGEHTLAVDVADAEGRVRTVRASFDVANGQPSFDPSDPFPGMPVFVPPPATLYVATNGNDNNTGRTTNDPLRTIQRAANIAQPGDTIYIRAGTYPIQVAFTRSGTPTQPITWTSYPGETAILDGSNQTPVESSHRVWVQNITHNTFANLEIRNGPREGIIIQHAHHNLFTHLHIHGHHTSGILNMHSNHNTFQYIVTHNNYDRYNPSGRIGDDADGISISSGDSNTLYRVIAYNNSDDGIDTWRSTNTTIDSSIAFNNGRGSHGDGNGIKAGGNNDHVHTIVRNSITFNNRANGFDDNSGQHVTFINNTAYNNHGANFSAGPTATLRNNLSIGSRIGMHGSDHQHNSWNLNITDPGITTTDPTHPHFLTLTTTSPARNAGTTTHNTTSTDLGAIPHGHTITTITNHTLQLHLDIMTTTP
jgi:hypothetical protein